MEITNYFKFGLDVISDMAADTTGSKSLTQSEQISYAQVINFSKKYS